MFNACFRIINNAQDAEDIMQESFLKAFKNIDTYKGEVAFGAWLKRIVINNSIDFLRKRKIKFIELESKFNDYNGYEEDNNWDIEDRIRYNEVLDEIQNLPVGYKMILTLYLLEGYDHNEISEILKINPSTSRTQFKRAKDRLIENLNKKSKK
jgi:RNA polymerase sigma-70 factor (ECF subfamily)